MNDINHKIFIKKNPALMGCNLCSNRIVSAGYAEVQNILVKYI